MVNSGIHQLHIDLVNWLFTSRNTTCRTARAHTLPQGEGPLVQVHEQVHEGVGAIPDDHVQLRLARAAGSSTRAGMP